MATQCAGRAEAELPLVRLGMVGDGVKRTMRFDSLQKRSDQALSMVKDGHLSSPDIDFTMTI
jgi:hypothetical protein